MLATLSSKHDPFALEIWLHNQTGGDGECPWISLEEVVAETEGFEPSIHFTTYDDLANRCLQPLGHVSANRVAADRICRAHAFAASYMDGLENESVLILRLNR